MLDQGTDNVLVNAISLRLPGLSSTRAAAPLHTTSAAKAAGPVAKF